MRGGDEPRRRPIRLCAALATAAWLAAIAAGTASAAVSRPGFPNPLSGPGHPEVGRSDAKRINKAWKRMVAGKSAAATKAASRLGDDPASRLLRLQIAMTATDEPSVEGLQSLTSENGQYAAAWATLSVAAERAGDESTSYAAARRSADLWPEAPWTDRFADLQHRWVWQRIVTAERMVDADQPEQALREIERVLMLESDRKDALLIEGRALIQLGRTDEAVVALEKVRERPGALMLLGEVAEERGDWLAAMEYYAALPPGVPDREASLRRAQLRWRQQNLPGYVRQALASVQLTRAELAVVLVGLVPEAQALGGGRVPVLSDIVDLPCQREILTVARLDMMNVDEIEHRFHPDRMARPEEIRRAVDRLFDLLDQQPVRWCDEGSVISSSCTALPAPVSGEAVAKIILDVAHGVIDERTDD